VVPPALCQQGWTPGLGEAAEPLPVLVVAAFAEGKIPLQSKALLCCKMPNENFKMHHSKPEAGGCPAQGGSGSGTGAAPVMPRAPVPPPAPLTVWDLFIAHPALIKLGL